MLDYGKIYLCKPQGILLGIPNGIKEETGSLKESMTDIWELTFEVDRYVDINGKRVESSYYSSLSEKMELLYEDNKQNRCVRFIIDKEPEINIATDKFQETKTVIAHSIEADLQTKFLRNFKINCGIEDSQEYLIYDEQGRQINVYQYDADTILPIDYIVLDCRLDDVCMKAKAYLKEKDFKLKEHIVQNTEVIKYLQSLIKKVPRLQKDVYYDANGILKSHIYVYTNGETISVDSKQSFLDGLDSLVTYYKKYKNKLSLFSLALENAKESGWTVDTSHLTDELANTKWNFEIGSQDIYSFLNNTLANYARIIILYDRNHKSVGAVSVNDVGNDTGVSISMKNLVNSVDITSTSENGIKTKMYPVGGDHLSIENVNFGSPYLINYDYFVDALDDYGDYKYGNIGLYNRYHQWKEYCDKDTELYGMSRRQKYIEASKKYNKCMLDIDELTNRVPNDGCNINYTSYKYDELILSLNAYNNSIQSIVDMYKAEYHADKVYDTSGSIPTDYPIDSNVIYQFDELPNGIIPINETYYWHDYYAFKTAILPKVYEALKIWCKTITQFDEAYKKNIVYLSTNENGKLYLSQIAESNLVYLETGNAEYATESHLLNTVDSWMYEWELFGLDELKSKLKGWNEAAASLFREEFVEKDNNGDIIYEEKDYGGGYIVTYPKPKLDNAKLTNSAGESLKELNNNFKYWLDYVSDDINRSVKNNMTGRTGGEKGMGIMRQCEKAIGELMDKIKKLQTEQQIYSTLRKTLQSECSYETNIILTNSDRAILNSLESSCDYYSNENIAVTSLDDVVSTVDIQERLYQDAYEKLYENSIPQYSFNSTNENLFSIAEFAPMINQCIVGNYIRVGINLFQDMYVKLRLISIIKNPFVDDMELDMEFSSMTKTLNGFSDSTYLLDDMNTSSTNSSSSSNSGNYGDNKYSLQFSANLLNALLTNDALKTATSDAVLNSIKSDNGVFVKLLATNGIFDSLKVGDIGISGDCLITGQIKSNNYSPSSGSVLNLDDGNFSFGGGSLTYLDNKLNITGDIQGSNFIGGTIQSYNYDSDKKLGSIFDLNNGTFCFADGKLNYDGTDLKLSGKLDGVTGQFKSGNIGSFILDENEISSGTEISAGMGVSGKRPAFWAGADKGYYEFAPFIVTHDGKLKTSNIEVTGGQIAIPFNDESFYEDTNGNSKIGSHGLELKFEYSNSLSKQNFKCISTYTPYGFKLARCEYGSDKTPSDDIFEDFKTYFSYNSSSCEQVLSRRYLMGEIYSSTWNERNLSFIKEFLDDSENPYAAFGIDGMSNQTVYDDITSTGSPVYIDSDGVFHRYASSSKRYKNSISYKLPSHLNPHALYDINVVSYKYNDLYLSKNDQRTNKDFIGFISEDIYKKYPIACDLSKDGKPEMWNIYILFPALVKLVQEQHEELENLKKTIKPTI